MNDKLKQFLNEVFKPYGNFPARKDVEQELLANLTEKYNDHKTAGKSDEEAFQLTTESFGDVSEIMEQVSHGKQTDGIAISDGRFRATALVEADLAGSKLSGGDFSMSALMGANFQESDARQTKFKATALKGASFAGADLTKSTFDSSDLQDVNFNSANLTDAKLVRCALKGAAFYDAVLDNTEFKRSDLNGVSFEGQTLRGTIFDGTSLKDASFRNAVLENVSFHHSPVKKTVFDGAAMDKVTYALLQGMKADLDNVTVK